MTVEFSFKEWRERLHVCKDFASEEKCDEYLSLLNIAENNLSPEVATELVRTFSDADDFGLMERTRNILENTSRAIFYPVLLQELGALISRAPEKQWAITLVGIELEYGDFDLLLSCAMKSPEEIKQIFLNFIKSDEFLDEYPAVLKYLGSRPG